MPPPVDPAQAPGGAVAPGRSAFEIAQSVRGKTLAARAVLEEHIALVLERNPALNALCATDFDAARRRAGAIDAALRRGEPVGPLAGVPVVISDTLPAAGLVQSCGAEEFRHRLPEEDAEVVRRLVAAGAILLGKANTSEHGLGPVTVNPVHGATINPWHAAVSAGGPAGGAATAAAAGMCALAAGEDLDGGLLAAAAFCGVVGLRPTAGVVPNLPSAQPWDDLLAVGPLARSAEDCALALDALLGLARAAPRSLQAPWQSAFDEVSRGGGLEGMRIGFVADLAAFGTEAAIARITRQAAHSLTRWGARVEDEELNLSDGIRSFGVLRACWMVAQHYDRLDDLERLSGELSATLRAGMALDASDRARAERKRAQLWHRLRGFFERYDVLAMPATACLPFPAAEPPQAIGVRRLTEPGEWMAPAFLTGMLGVPAVSVPAGIAEPGLPVGLQLVGPRFSEPRLLRMAKFVQRQWGEFR